MIPEKNIEEFLSLIRRTNPLILEQMYTAYREAGAPDEWLETAMKQFPILRTEQEKIMALERLKEPTIVDMAQNFTTAMTNWVKRGFPVVHKEDYLIRSNICEPCEFWDGNARLGLGKCKSPGCGCTSFKRWLASEKCHQNKWPELTKPILNLKTLLEKV